MVAYDNTLGAVFIGGWVAAIFYGITCVQAFFFLWHKQNTDRRSLKYAVAALWLADTLHSIFVAKTLYWYMVTRFAQPNSVMGMPWSMMASVCMDNISDTMVRIFFTYRVWILSGRNRIVTGILIFLVVFVPVTGFVGAGFGFTFSSFIEFSRIGWLMLLTFAAAVVADVYVAVSLVFFLLRSRTKPTGFSSDLFKRTDTLINGLIIYFINTGVLTCLASTFCLCFYIAYPHNFIFLAFHFPISPIYVNALLGSLNARPSMRAHCAEPSYGSSSVFPTSISSRRTTMSVQSPATAVQKEGYEITKFSVHTSDSDTLDGYSAIGYGPPKRGTAVAFSVAPQV